ncbi:MAG: gliding motility-associated C-terminal domain-containing protein [Saprospiraceae bacterium]|nr:gliding motility-associated C-terminal domain-containing protein [Saprospiraceae bacterium]MBK7737732.1 gliding motility-associated C-terminal domain-containing protein [Saprospiraceae bacterium]MBK7913684.1 gliding motility-associated C-terminal domain-containing protein [Saprospiraceae bacterium]
MKETRGIINLLCLLIPCMISSQAQNNSQHHYAMPNSCGITVNAGPDITICVGQGKNLSGMVSNSTNYSWEPPDGLSNPNALNPVANPSMTTTYTLTARAMSGNLIANGGFETGSINPSTSQYTQYNTIPNLIGSTGGYMIMSVPQIAQAFGCNPNIGSFTMAITPTSSNVMIWCQQINVSKNTDYKIEYKVFGIPYIFGPPPTIGLLVNGSFVGSIDAISGTCVEADASFIWNSGNATSANICLANYGGTGAASMCAIDDITAKECCEEKDEVTVTVYDLIADVNPVDDINCTNRPLTIDASGSSTGPGISYDWSTKNGHIVSGAKTLTPVIDTPGTYTLKITGLYGCEKEVMVMVNGSTTPPDIKIKAVNIDCKNPTGSLEASSKSSSPQFEWNGPNGYYNTRANIYNLTEAGEYTVKVTDSYGCESTAKVDLKDNRSFIEAEIIGDSITCNKDSAILKAESIGLKPIYSWKGPLGFKKDSSIKAIVRDTGWYYLTTLDSFGCQEIDSFYVKDLQTSLAIAIRADTLTCAIQSVQLKLVTDTSATIFWTGPNGFNSNSRQPFVVDQGWYVVQVTTGTGCMGLDSIFVVKSSDVPDLYISTNDTITCSKPSIQINGGSNTMGAQFKWITPVDTIFNQSNIIASDSGSYTLIVTGPNGCSVNKSINIFKDVSIPSLSGFPDTLTCTKDSLILKLTSSTVETISWTGPNGFVSQQLNPVVTEKGTYKLTVTGFNGCTNTIDIAIAEDKAVPSLQISGDTLNCIRTAVIPGVTVDSTITKFNWSGPSNFTSSLKYPMLTTGGNYTLQITGSNGCTQTQTLNIVEDFVKPSAQLEADTIQCKSTASIRALNSPAGLPIQWTGPNNFVSNLANPTITKSGFYVLTIIGTNGCVFTDSIFVFQKDQLPDIFASDDTLTCIKQKLMIRAGSATQGVIFEWTGPNGFTSNMARPEIQDSGLYTLKVTDPNGCESIKQIFISKFADIPALNLIASNNFISCKDSTVNLKIQTTNQPKTIIWIGPNGFSANTDSIVAIEPGTYRVVLTSDFGCVASDSVSIQDIRKLPTFTVADDSLNCKRSSINLTLNSNDTDLNFNWSGPNNFSSILKNPTIQMGGTYFVTVTNSADCKLIQMVQISIDTITPDLSLSADTITCLRNSAPVKASSSLQGFTMKWTGPNGFNYTLPQFATKIPGRYFCTITNPRSGCSNSSFIDILEDTNRIRNISTQSVSSSCNRNNGKLIINQIIGGKAPYKYSLDNGANFINDIASIDFAPGNYNLIVEDANGCQYSVAFNIIETGDVRILVSPKIELLFGSKQTLNLTILSNPNDISSILWTPSDQLSCSNCPDPEITADHDDIITVTVTDKNGCSATATIQLVVKKESKVYFPNAFSPNGDNINDYFYPIGLPSDAPINIFNIYDRWGNLVFSKENFVLNSEKDGWGGTTSGSQEKLNPGVFIYMIEIQDVDGPKIYTGDISLIQ